MTWLLPHLPFPTTGRRAQVALAELVGTILYKLKTGCQWRFSGQPLTWQGVYYFRQWSRQGAWKSCGSTCCVYIAAC